MNRLTVNIKKLSPDAIIPSFGSEQAAGADLYACINEPIVIPSGACKVIPTGIAMEIPAGFAGFVHARSGLATKRGLAPANKVGVIDSDYRGEIMVALFNHSPDDAEIAPGERIAQIVIMPVSPVEFCETDELDKTSRGSGGFGSTGK